MHAFYLAYTAGLTQAWRQEPAPSARHQHSGSEMAEQAVSLTFPQPHVTAWHTDLLQNQANKPGWEL